LIWKNDEEREPKFLKAAQRGSVKEIQKLLESGEKINTKEQTYGWTALFFVIYFSNLDFERYFECLKLLIGAGAKVNVRDKKRQTPLHWAIRKQLPPKWMNLLLEAGARIYENRQLVPIFGPLKEINENEIELVIKGECKWEIEKKNCKFLKKFKSKEGYYLTREKEMKQTLKLRRAPPPHLFILCQKNIKKNLQKKGNFIPTINQLPLPIILKEELATFISS
jgi:ankyrin repeat protein